MKLIVCPANHTRDNFERWRPSHVLGLLSPDQDEVVLPGAAAQRLELRFNDIAAPRKGLIAPDAKDLRAILSFARSWDGVAPMLIYCFAGISRSTAAAFAIACQHQSSASERDIAIWLRRVSPSATPNILMVALADALLLRGGRMVDAIAAIGRGEGYFESTSFEIVI